ncbi:MAG: hypothetical protein A3C49_03385 [Candidatus Doudnabacteria bacterium RIFCSPHIGHO2_02_FULL_42_25]|uniref:Uncharacterized protein n=1 Tax=Candidatus Doudnabacteria bacterium RIFCSPHIGHO2_01_FULL_41_86 TaxID=1817821 RepID=A0A1F5N855_9BACT|nr:MAG: hypothetical protein A2717_04360 [Candidatus Doudnabacteria bacterium RIFCSPHIGHO2_01_FULL_41_86]OGE75845.1 MAG: hypothetical protein A3K07_03955 [Candidatus Doudnabacteria bacterium RIFCSPHIGHO2_01_43_10]OGE86219.1 MAG: hypothetical protein A3E28_03715 [Candidatus Doudnabacteria bacterium RIFCSPHIGHO2_12_FULL_42_22]OGE87068.1 MAG: hypothetical protein A3C49_03385 [Candidatus Doudnabacteria bacterium RIFCSPHIGHO2_02_FULL_42_25]OGE92207.1 MAG: hypothetical protein A2895_04065 [Candidatus
METSKKTIVSVLALILILVVVVLWASSRKKETVTPEPIATAEKSLVPRVYTSYGTVTKLETDKIYINVPILVPVQNSNASAYMSQSRLIIIVPETLITRIGSNKSIPFSSIKVGQRIQIDSLEDLTKAVVITAKAIVIPK